MLFHCVLKLLTGRRIQGQGYQHPGRAMPTPLIAHLPLAYASTASNINKCVLVFGEAFQDCNCCESAAVVVANVDPEGKLGKEQGKGNGNGNGRGADVGANVGPVGNGSGKGNGNGLGNGISKSNGTSVSEERFPRQIAMATHGNNSYSDKKLLKLIDHGYLIATFDEFKKMIPCHLQPRRDRQMQKRSHDVRFEEREDKTKITKLIDISIDIHEQSRHGHAVGPVEDGNDDGRSVGGHVPVGDGDDHDACSPPRSVFPVYFDTLDSQMVGTEDEMHIESHDEPEAEGNVEFGRSCDVGRDQDKSHGDSWNVVGSESSPSTLRKQK